MAKSARNSAKLEEGVSWLDKSSKQSMTQMVPKAITIKQHSRDPVVIADLYSRSNAKLIAMMFKPNDKRIRMLLKIVISVNTAEMENRIQKFAGNTMVNLLVFS